MLVSRLDTAKLSQFSLTQMELALRPDIVGAQDPSSIPLIDVQRFCPVAGAAELDAEDRALIDGNSTLKPRSDVSWLMRTKYMQGRDYAAAAPRTAPRREAERPLTLEEAAAQIEASFHAAQQPPTHPTRPDLKPVAVMPVLPDEDKWGNEYVTASSTEAILSSVDVAEATDEQRAELLRRCVLRAYECPEEGVPAALRGRRFLALCVPSATDSTSALEAAEGEEEFRWVREFLFHSRQDLKGAKPYAISLQDKGAFYVPILCDYVLGKRKRQDFANVPVPEKVTIALREANEAELQERKTKMASLFGVDDA